MDLRSSIVTTACLLVACAALPMAACEREPAKPPTATPPSSGTPTTATPPKDGHSHASGDAHGDHDHDHDHAAGGEMHGDDHHHGPTTALGEKDAGAFKVRASRDGEIKAGSDAPIDVWVTGGTEKVSAVRFWIGVESAKGSVKARAELEKDNWHTHADVPSPLPAGSALWVEIETDKGSKVLVSFDLKS